MPRRSTITLLDPRIREAVDRLIRENRATIDDIVASIDGLASRSAVGRYVKSAREQMAKYREAQEIAKVWIGKLEAEPEGDVGRLLSEMLRTVAFEQISKRADGEASTPLEMSLLARTIKDLSAADKTSADRLLRVRREVQVKAEKVAEEVVQTARKAGLTAEGAAAIRARILGIAA
ncbi:MAG: DUF3486 family protein [Gammaproteobacteria bacterium]|nr:DUF3486 family protein [Gammaproteobacteria bacterium]